MLIEVKGLVIRTVNLSDNDKLLTLFTEEYGKLTAVANGSRVLKSRYLAAAQLFCYGSYVLYKKGDRYWVREVNLIESFFDLRADLSRTSLAAYICEVADDVVEENAPEKVFLRLVLNSLYAASKGQYPQKLIKAAFELRAACLLGFQPMIERCHACGNEKGAFYLDVMNGIILCAECYGSGQYQGDVSLSPDDIRTSRIICPLTEGAWAAMIYTVFCPLERIFSFRIDKKDLEIFAYAAEKYLLNHLERGFKSLDFYKEIADE